MNNNLLVFCFFMVLAAQAADKKSLVEYNSYQKLSCGELCSERHRIEVAMDERLERWLDEKSSRRDMHNYCFACSVLAPAVCACCITFIVGSEDYALNAARGLLSGLFSGSLWAYWYQPDQSDYLSALTEINELLKVKIKND